MDLVKVIIFYIVSLVLLIYGIYCLSISYKMAGIITIHELGVILFGITLAFMMLIFSRMVRFTLKTIYKELKGVNE